MTKKARKKELTQIINDDGHLEIDACQRKPWSFVRIVFGYEDKCYTGLGFSKVCYPDKWDKTRGGDIAYHKAVAHIVKQIMAKGGGES